MSNKAGFCASALASRCVVDAKGKQTEDTLRAKTQFKQPLTGYRAHACPVRRWNLAEARVFVPRPINCYNKRDCKSMKDISCLECLASENWQEGGFFLVGFNRCSCRPFTCLPGISQEVSMLFCFEKEKKTSFGGDIFSFAALWSSWHGSVYSVGSCILAKLSNFLWFLPWKSLQCLFH